MLVQHDSNYCQLLLRPYSDKALKLWINQCTEVLEKEAALNFAAPGGRNSLVSAWEREELGVELGRSKGSCDCRCERWRLQYSLSFFYYYYS